MIKPNPKYITVVIDLGTGAILAIDVNGYLVTLERTKTSMPSDIAIEEDGTILVGTPAQHAAVVSPERHCSGYKRYVGRKEPLMAVDGKDYTAQDLAAIGYGKVFQVLQQESGTQQIYAVLTAPVEFEDYSRQCLKAAAEATQGVKVIGIVDEPMGAAAYASQNRTPGTVVLVFDAGAGTSDVCLLKWIEEGKFKVLEKRGDRDLGGNNIEQVLFQEALKRAKAKLSGKINYKDPSVLHELADLKDKVRDGKEELSQRSKTTLVYYLGGKRFVWEITRDEFNQLVQPILDGQQKLIESTLEDAGLGPQDVNEVIAVGGTSLVPTVREMLERVMGQMPTCKGDPQEAVVRGGLLLMPEFMKDFGGPIREAAEKLPSVPVEDISRFPVSVVVVDDDGNGSSVASEIIKQGAPLPAESSKTYSPHEDNQKNVRITIVEAKDGTIITDDMILGCGEIPIPPRSGSENKGRIYVRVKLDKSGMIHVYGRDEVSGNETEFTINYV